MRAIILITIVSIALTSFGQKQITSFQRKYILSGQVVYSSEYIGGIDPGDRANPEYPFKDLMLYIVKLEGEEMKPKIVGNIKTDEQGRFSTIVNPGIYGLVTEKDLKDLSNGQFLPADVKTDSKEYFHRSIWYSNLDKPFDLQKKDLRNVIIHNQRKKICYKCP